MEQFGVVILIAIVAVAFMMFGLAITVIRKGRPLQSDVGNNDDMKKMGLKCTAQQFREDELKSKGQIDCTEGCDKCGL